MKLGMRVFLITALAGCTPASIDGTPPSPPPEFMAPANLTAKKVEKETPSVALAWSYDGTPVPEFGVFRAASADSLQKILANPKARPVLTIDELKVVDTGLVPGRKYFYAVRAMQDTLLGPPSNVASVDLGLKPDEPPLAQLTSTSSHIPAIPGEACGNITAYHIVAINPPLGTVLSPNQTVTIRAEIQYSAMENDTIGLQVTAGDDYNSETQADVGAGCGSIFLEVKDVRVDSAATVWVSTTSDWGYMDPSVVYRVAGMPYLSIIGASPMAGAVSGVTEAALTLTWDFGDSSFDAGWYRFPDFESGEIPFPDSAGENTYFFPIAPDGCGISRVSLTVREWYASVSDVITFFVEGNAGIASFWDTYFEGPGMGTVRLENCSGYAMDVTFSSTAAWLIPGGPVQLAASDLEFSEFEVDVTGVEPGFHAATLIVWFDGAASSATRISVEVIEILDSGYAITETTFSWLTPLASTMILAGGVDDGASRVTAPFALELFQEAFTQVTVTSNGVVKFGDQPGAECCGGSLPTNEFENAIALLWDDLLIPADGSISHGVIGETPNRQWVITYNNVGAYPDGSGPSDFQIVLYENTAQILIQYGDLQTSGAAGLNLGDGQTALLWTPADSRAYLIAPQ